MRKCAIAIGTSPPIVRFVASAQMDARTRTVAGQEVPQLEARSLKDLRMQRERNRGELQRQVKQLTCSCNLGVESILGVQRIVGSVENSGAKCCIVGE